MNAKEIYDILRAGGLTRAGALGMLGNMYAESTLKENIAQRGMTKLTDEQYTAAADNGLLDFIRDSVGYGLCQWTHYSRKQALLDYAKSKDVSLGNGAMQVNFCLQELQKNFPTVYKTLCTSSNIDECADLVCVRYEMPAVNNYAARRNYAHKAAEEIPEDGAYTPVKKDPVSATFPPDPSIFIMQLLMQYNTYWDGPIDGHYSDAFIKAYFDFGEGMKKVWSK